MLNEARCGKFVPVKDARALTMAIEEYMQLPKDQLESIGRRGKDWLLKNRPYDKLAVEYCRIFETGLSQNEAPV
jgi:hypothetical protein